MTFEWLVVIKWHLIGATNKRLSLSCSFSKHIIWRLSFFIYALLSNKFSAADAWLDVNQASSLILNAARQLHKSLFQFRLTSALKLIQNAQCVIVIHCLIGSLLTQFALLCNFIDCFLHFNTIIKNEAYCTCCLIRGCNLSQLTLFRILWNDYWTFPCLPKLSCKTFLF